MYTKEIITKALQSKCLGFLIFYYYTEENKKNLLLVDKTIKSVCLSFFDSMQYRNYQEKFEINEREKKSLSPECVR